MDLAINLDDTLLYIRVAAIIKSRNGFLFEKNPHGYIYLVGGKIKLNESSEEALKREVFEETGMNVANFKLQAVMENIYESKDMNKVHEICFMYEVEDLFTGELPPTFIEITPQNVDNYDVRPKPMYDLIKNTRQEFMHIVVQK
jgi:8-oxo-dGTP pyrophosphatase MutT (NUDIX family)